MSKSHWAAMNGLRWLLENPGKRVAVIYGHHERAAHEFQKLADFICLHGCELHFIRNRLLVEAAASIGGGTLHFVSLSSPDDVNRYTGMRMDVVDTSDYECASLNTDCLTKFCFHTRATSINGVYNEYWDGVQYTPWRNNLEKPVSTIYRYSDLPYNWRNLPNNIKAEIIRLIPDNGVGAFNGYYFQFTTNDKASIVAFYKARKQYYEQKMSAEGAASAQEWFKPQPLSSNELYERQLYKHQQQAYRLHPPHVIKLEVDTSTNEVLNRISQLYPVGRKERDRILPSIYTRLAELIGPGNWLRGNRVISRINGMNEGHLENSLKLLNESHGNLVAKSTELLGRMAKHLGAGQPLVDACLRMQETDVSTLYPVFDELEAELILRRAGRAPTPIEFADDELTWYDLKGN